MSPSDFEYWCKSTNIDEMKERYDELKMEHENQALSGIEYYAELRLLYYLINGRVYDNHKY